jgi:hypothetical protein
VGKEKRGELEQALPSLLSGVPGTRVPVGQPTSRRERIRLTPRKPEEVSRVERPDRRFRFDNARVPPASPPRNQTLLILLTLARALARPLQRRSHPDGGVGRSCQFDTHAAGTAREQRLKLAPSLELFAYWNALRGARGAPERNDIEPGAIRGVLADTFILEFSAADGFPFRVVGSRTNALFGRELRGAPFLEIWRRDDAAEIARVLESAADGAQPFLIGARGGPDGVAAVDFEVLLLPLRHHGATHARAFGCCAPNASAAWFGLLPIRPLAVASLRALNSAQDEEFPALAPNTTEIRRRGHLFVYSSRN